ncbi:hypothetical protein RRG08_004996 [Elysia crispata]|uniref:Uncharacterized protein n=1 Tax=Elysia crispata TaxID=231223 RepID=A0AAE1E5H7_9GAST|nr:hypothetical protein RRG08_004996 [Elysia crispata]
MRSTTTHRLSSFRAGASYNDAEERPVVGGISLGQDGVGRSSQNPMTPVSRPTASPESVVCYLVAVAHAILIHTKKV